METNCESQSQFVFFIITNIVMELYLTASLCRQKTLHC